ncbi:PAS domain-containing sensor histidine kinase [Roseovarius arcticus]|uniref:PAS domain-containing sensor histidine kinase n=1 Tax=Roseovarius arcticus TaxID=2547404 RepID=UPI0014866DA9|nr:PAS domain-containing sensor histidine kinase [Roseovarius arcticus]
MDDASIIHAFRHMQVPLMIIGPDGTIQYCNDATHRLFGYGGDDLIGRASSLVLPVASVAELNAHIKAPASNANIKDMLGTRKCGSPIPLAVHMTASNDAIQGLQHALVLRDITDERDAACLARNELTRANNAIKGARIGVFEYTPLTETVIVSDIWRELLELDPTDEVDVQVEWRERVHPDDLAAALEPIRICLEDISERASCEYRLRSKNGSRWRWMQTDVAVARRDQDGKVIRVIGAMTDITERKTAENDLRRSVEQFRSAFDNATVGKAIVGLDGQWLGANRALCDLLGYSEEELLKTNFQSLTHPDDLDSGLIKLDHLKEGNARSYQTEKRYIRSNGAVMWGLLSVGIVKDADGMPDHFISQIVDVTEQRRLNELRSEFVATVSHELRTPLTSVLGSLTLLSTMDSEPLSDGAQRLLFIAQENGKRLHALVDDILDFEKFSARQMRFSPSRQCIIGLVEEATMANLASADRFGVRFNIICPDRSLTGFVDPKRFQQVITNLLSNAAKFADRGSMIDVTVEEQSRTVRISVANDGDGIPDSFRDDIFKPFSQASSAATRARGGTGVGLNITKQIVEQTGGTIGFDSHEGGKTIFWFTVPIEDPH